MSTVPAAAAPATRAPTGGAGGPAAVASVTDIRSRRARPAGPGRAQYRTHRRVALLADRGVEGFLQVTTALRAFDGRLRDVSADVREGVRVSEIVCTVSVTADEMDALVRRLAQESAVISVETR